MVGSNHMQATGRRIGPPSLLAHRQRISPSEPAMTRYHANTRTRGRVALGAGPHHRAMISGPA